MGIRGRSIEKDYSLEQLIDICYECSGVVSHMAQKTGYHRNAIWTYIDIYPEMQEARKKAQEKYRNASLETAEVVLNKLMTRADTDPGNANRAAQFILKQGRKSPYNPDNKDDFAGEQLDRSLDRLETYVDERVSE